MSTMPCGKGLDHLIEEARRQETIIVAIATADLPEIVTRPIELIALCHDDPRRRIVKSEMTFDCCRNFNGACGISGSSMRDRQDHNDRCVIRWPLDRQHDHPRTILATFFPSGRVLAMPQIGVGYDKARFGRRYRHAPRYLFRLKQGIEMRVPLVHA